MRDQTRKPPRHDDIRHFPVNNLPVNDLFVVEYSFALAISRPGNNMKSPLDHPWLSEPAPFAETESIRVCMKNTAAMLEHDSPPEWIILLDEVGRFAHSRARVVVAEQNTIDFEPQVGDPPLTATLSDQQSSEFAAILSRIDADTNLDADNAVIDGSPCVVSVISGNSRWVNFGEFNLAGMTSGELLKPGPTLATFVRTIAHEIA